MVKLLNTIITKAAMFRKDVLPSDHFALTAKFLSPIQKKEKLSKRVWDETYSILFTLFR